MTHDLIRADDKPVSAPIPAASVAVMRDGARGLELLYLRRSQHLRFAPLTWVFPGGRIDEGDHEGDPNEVAIAQRAAAREAAEEANLDLQPKELAHIYHWTTPEDAPRRFATWFFVASWEKDTVRVDGQEIIEHRWATPSDALTLREEGKMDIAVPVFVLSTRLARCSSMREARAEMRTWLPEVMEPRSFKISGGRVALYQGDAGYDSRDPELKGSRHRMWMLDSGWKYERH